MNKKLLILITLFLHNSYAAEPPIALMQNNVMINQKSKTQDRVPTLKTLAGRSLANAMLSKNFLSDHKKDIIILSIWLIFLHSRYVHGV